jgi:perosamine synthetase
MRIRDNLLPVQQPVATEEDIEAVAEVLRSGWWGKGPKVEQFEKEFASMVGAKFAVAVTSNSHGQDLIFKALGLRNIDVMSPAISFMTTAAVPLWNDCSSTIVDVRRTDLNIDPEDVKKHLRPNTEMIIAVNHAGVPAPIEELRNNFDGFILEDCAHSCHTPGAGLKGDAAVWSFQAIKTMPTGDGGMITTNDRDLYEKLVPLTWFGITSTYSRLTKVSENLAPGLDTKPGYAWDYEVDVLGYKAYMTDLTAALGLSQMKRLPANLAHRREIQTRYNKELSNQVERPAWSETVQYYGARVEARHRDNLISYLADKNIHTSVHYKPLYKYSILQQYREYPIAETEWKKLVTLPCHNGMNSEDVDYVIYWVNKFFSNS